MNNEIYKFLSLEAVHDTSAIESQKENRLSFIRIFSLVLDFISYYSFLDIPYKVALITGLMVLGEVLFLIAIALLGKEYWAKIKQWFSKVFRKVKPKEN